MENYFKVFFRLFLHLYCCNPYFLLCIHLFSSRRPYFTYYVNYVIIYVRLLKGMISYGTYQP